MYCERILIQPSSPGGLPSGEGSTSCRQMARIGRGSGESYDIFYLRSAGAKVAAANSESTEGARPTLPMADPTRIEGVVAEFPAGQNYHKT